MYHAPAMDPIVARAMAKWPDVPDVYGWLSLDRRGNWRLREERIANAALREFISRNYDRDTRGRWFFQNGPQRVFVTLAYAPLVVHLEADRLMDHCGRPFEAKEMFLDEEGSLLLAGGVGLALLDDRDLERFSAQAGNLPRVAAEELPRRYGFIRNPSP
jgi:hypothetical protein